MAQQRETRTDPSASENMRQLIALRWLAVIGQYATIQFVASFLGVRLPLASMFAIIGGVIVLNFVGLAALRRGVRVGERELLSALLVDVAALSGLLLLSGGATNPFVSILLLQVVLGAVLLRAWSAWIIAAVTCAAFVLLALFHRPLVLPPGLTISYFGFYILGSLISFVLVAGLLVLFVTRIGANLRSRDRRLAAMRQQAAEEEHIVRMGLLASGAAHELGTPLASLSVIVNDWSRSPQLTEDASLAEEIEDMRIAVERCKTIVSGILMSAGDPRGEHIEITTLDEFFAQTAQEWRQLHGEAKLNYENRCEAELEIIFDSALKQVVWNLLDNGWEASRLPVSMIVDSDDTFVRLTVCDDGPGFDPDILANLGKPYQSTKAKQGGGLGLFLVMNAVRKMGGVVDAANDPSGGAVVTLTWPIETLALDARRQMR